MAAAESYKVSASGQLSLPAPVRRRWNLVEGGRVDVLDLGFAVMTLPEGEASKLLNTLLPAEAHYRWVAELDDPDLRS